MTNQCHFSQFKN